MHTILLVCLLTALPVHASELQLIDPPTALTDAERQWTNLIHSRSPEWQSEIASLAENFAATRPPAITRIAINNTEGRDAYTIDGSTIGFDVAKLNALYGDASLPENAQRIDRFFRHEYTHVLQRAWLAEHPYRAETPLRAALLDIWLEGLGNYYSLSQRWHGSEAEKTLTHLGPRFVARLAALACGSSDSEKLMADLSAGSFGEKWGALPAALWLEAEGAGALSRFVGAGPDGVWDLADRHLPPDSRAILREARQAAAVCEKK